MNRPVGLVGLTALLVHATNLAPVEVDFFELIRLEQSISLRYLCLGTSVASPKTSLAAVASLTVSQKTSPM